jgi:hypothetical protein
MYCRTNLSVPISLAGISGPCPNCGNSITAPFLPQQATQPQYTLPRNAEPPTRNIPAHSELPQIESRRPIHVTGHSLQRLSQMPITRDLAYEPTVNPIPESSPVAEDLPDTSAPHYGTFTDSHAIPIEQIQRPSSRKKKKPVAKPTKIMFLACFVVLAFIAAVAYQLKNQKSDKPSGTKKQQMADVSKDPSSIQQNNDTIENILDGTEDQKKSTAIAEDDPSKNNEDLETDPRPNSQSAKYTKMVEQFLKAADYSERKSFVATKLPEDVILESFANKKWPHSTVYLEPIEIDDKERKTTYRFHVNFSENAAGFPSDALIVVNQVGSNPAKIALDPLIDTIGGNLHQFAQSPFLGDNKLYGIQDDTEENPFVEPSSLKDSQDFYCVVNAREKSYETTKPVPGIEKKCTFNLRAYSDGKEIAVAYANEKSNVREAFANRTSGLSWNNSKPMRLTLKWNIKEDPKKPFIEVIAIKSIGWSD